MRYNNLYSKLLDKELLSEAFDNAARGKKNQPSVVEAIAHKEELIDRLYEMLLDDAYEPSRYQIIHKFEPKYREIFVAPFFPERVLHHAIMLVLIPILERQFYEHSYSCIKGKGQHKAAMKNLELAQQYKYCLKCDISKFYPSINREILLNIFKKFIKDRNFIELLKKIIYSAPDSEWAVAIRKRLFNIGMLLENECTTDKVKELRDRFFRNIIVVSNICSMNNVEIDKLNRTTNVPIGNYCSQWFGNLYLTELDNVVTNRFNPNDKVLGEYFTEKVKYIRYCDDFIFYSNDKKDLNNVLFLIEQYLFWNRGLTLSKKKIFPTRHGVDFCGYKVFHNGKVRVRGSTKRRMRKRIRKVIYDIKHGYMTISKASSVVASYLGIVKFFDSKGLDFALKLTKLKERLDYYRINYPDKINNKVRLVFDD